MRMRFFVGIAAAFLLAARGAAAAPASREGKAAPQPQAQAVDASSAPVRPGAAAPKKPAASPGRKASGTATAAPAQAPAQAQAVEVSSPAVRLATAAPASVEEVMALFASMDEQLVALSARFQQLVRVPESGTSRGAEGTVEYQKPGRIRMEHARPEPQTVVCDGKTLWVLRRDQNQVIESNLEDWRRSDPTASRLLDFGSYSKLLKAYDVAYDSAALAVDLRPKDGKGDFLLRLRLTGPGSFPAETELSVGGVRILTRLSEIRFNPVLAPARFAFTPPAGAEVFRNFKPPMGEGGGP